jgi:RNA polymerase sigma-70 factor (ECF subfamily)
VDGTKTEDTPLNIVVAKKTDDTGILERFKQGDSSAFRDIVLTYQDRIYNLCLYMLQDVRDAQEAAQDAFVKAYRALPDFEPRASLYTWLYSIATRTCLDYRRKTIRTLAGEPLPEEMPCTDLSPEKRYETREVSEAVQRALQKLPAKLRAVIVLRELEELTYEEIGEVLDVSTGTVKSRISRAREELRKLLSGKL